MTTTIELKPVKYEMTHAALEDMRARLSNLQPTTPAGYDAVRKGIAECRDWRGNVEKMRQALKADALEYGRQVDAEARRITGLLLEIEEPLKARKKAVDDERDRVRREKAEAERQRVEAELRAKREAEEARLRAEREAEEARLKVERERLEAERRKLDEERIRREAEEAERRRADEERLAAEAERQRQERERLDAERRAIEAEKQRLEREEFERQAEMRAHRLADERRERERVAEEERRAAIRAEEARIEALKPDAEKLKAWAERLQAVEPPNVESEEAAEMIAAALDDLSEVASQLCNWQALVPADAAA